MIALEWLYGSLLAAVLAMTAAAVVMRVVLGRRSARRRPLTRTDASR